MIYRYLLFGNFITINMYKHINILTLQYKVETQKYYNRGFVNIQIEIGSYY